MRLAVRKIHVEDAAKLQTLVVENLDGIEPGLAVLDARLLLGHSTIDVVAMDAAGTLVLIAVGLTANEEMILKAVEAYSWSLEYPQALQRLYPGCVLSEERPPRLLFVVDRMSDAFQRKIKQLGFPEVDCVEVRHLEVDGVPTVYFESLSRIRRLATPPVIDRVPQATVPAPQPTRGPAGGGENVIVMNGNGTARSVAPRLTKPAQTEASLNSTRTGERTTPSRELGAVVSMINRQTAVVAADLPRPVIEPVVPRQPETVSPRPFAAEPKPTEPTVTKPSVAEAGATTPVVVQPSMPEPVVAKPLAVELGVPEPVVTKASVVGTSVSEPVATKPAAAPTIAPVAAPPTTTRTIAPAAPAPAPALLPPLAKPVATSVPSLGARPQPVTPRSLGAPTKPSFEPATKPAVEPVGKRVSFKDLAQGLLGGKSPQPRAEAPATPVTPATLTLLAPVAEPVVTEPIVAEPAPAAPVAVAPAAPALTVESLAAMAAPAAPVAAAEEAMVADTATQIMSALPQEFEGLTFPNDGVLTRQWMDFLNQMSTTK
jgi:hypothetical protein